MKTVLQKLVGLLGASLNQAATKRTPVQAHENEVARLRHECLLYATLLDHFETQRATYKAPKTRTLHEVPRPSQALAGNLETSAVATAITRLAKVQLDLLIEDECESAEDEP